MEYLSNLPYCLVGVTGSILIANNLVGRSFNKNISYNIIIIFIYALLSCIVYSGMYTPLRTVLSMLMLTLGIKFIFDFSVVSSVILSVITLLLLSGSELFMTMNLNFIDNIAFIKNDPIVLILTKITTILIAYLLSKIKHIQMIIRVFVTRYEKKVIKGELVYIFLMITIIFFFNYQIFSNRYLDNSSISFAIFIIMLIIFTSVYIYNKNRYKELEDNYNYLFEYACTYEEELEKEKLVRHEHKNQLAVIKGLTKNKKILNYIDDILENNKKEELISIKGINNLPKGGLRGLLYYKLSTIKRKKINFSLDISKSVKRSLSQLKTEETKILTYIIGVFCDNAIEECIKDMNSNISIEIYKIGKELSIIVSNTIVDKVNIRKIGERGYSTKGKNHGNGLYLVKKLIKGNNKIILKTKIINNYFVQELKIKGDQ